MSTSLCGHSRNQCSSSVSQTINAPLPLVWSLVRRFDNPQAYKRFVRSCNVVNATSGTAGIGSIRHVSLVSGTPATASTERLDSLDDELHVMAVSIIGGDHRLVNYRSTISLREEKSGGGEGCKVVVTESFMVDIPLDSNEEDTCTFVKTIIGFNLRTLAQVSEKMARHGDGFE